uniref:Uncharacterized protein n=1 Tax=Arundo donax TaxID=35708 RepID=A0A0A9DSQ4_ARUDO
MIDCSDFGCTIPGVLCHNNYVLNLQLDQLMFRG